MRSCYSLARLGVMFATAAALTACSDVGPLQPSLAGVTPGDGGEAHISVSTGRAQMHPFNQSGIHGVISFVDDGSTLTVSGSAHGLDPTQMYISLIYDNGSLPGGPLACEPTIFDPTDPDFILGTMFVGAWSVAPNGTGTLNATNTNGGADYVPLTKIRTISIRRVVGPGPAVLEACGLVARHPAS